MGIGKSIQRVDARAKVTGQAKYTQDLMTQPMMVAKAKKTKQTMRMKDDRLSFQGSASLQA